MKVTELLLLNEDFPRSAQFCISRVDQALRRISGASSERYTNNAERLSGRLYSELCFSRIEELVEPGLHKMVDELQTRFNQIGDAIYQTYINMPLPPAEPRPVRAALRQAAQIQQQ